LNKLRTAMGHRDSLYQLSGTIKVDDAFVGDRQKGSEDVVQQEKRTC
jgi:hypothetical protein